MIGQKVDDNNAEKHEFEAAYGFLLQLRNIDLDMLWTRSGFFFAINGALWGFLIGNLNTASIVLPFIAVFGFWTAFIWWKITELGCAWLVSWEAQLKDIENKVFPNSPDISIFRDNKYKGTINGSIKKILKDITLINLIAWIVLPSLDVILKNY